MKYACSKLSLILCFLIFSNLAFSQVSESYFKYVKTADSLSKQKQYIESCKYYSLAFKQNNNLALIDDRYSAAESWAMISALDSAFYNLFKIAYYQEKYTIEVLQTNEHFINLKNDKRWDSLIVITSNRKLKYNSSLSKLLDSVLNLDQSVREEYLSKRNKLDLNSLEYNLLIRRMHNVDSSNLKIVLDVINKYGWLGKDVIGYTGNMALFLVIQHSDIDVQEKMLPILEAAVKEKKALPNQLALLKDRISVFRAGKQIYGSQYYEKDGEKRLYPIIEPTKVNLRRIEMKLEPIEDYMNNNNILRVE